MSDIDTLYVILVSRQAAGQTLIVTDIACSPDCADALLRGAKEPSRVTLPRVSADSLLLEALLDHAECLNCGDGLLSTADAIEEGWPGV